MSSLRVMATLSIPVLAHLDTWSFIKDLSGLMTSAMWGLLDGCIWKINEKMIRNRRYLNQHQPFVMLFVDIKYDFL